MGIDWSQKLPAPEDRPLPDLTSLQFEFVLASQTTEGNFFEEILEDVLAGVKTGVPAASLPAMPEDYRSAKSKLAGWRFVFDDVLAMITLFQPYLAALYPTETIDEATLRDFWQEAAAVR